ncbi:MAG TPA: hypothetical protein VJR92_11270 [Gemmatimonadaceae bacterium]|nr:hypothetical protein [Gemmatimonadaceae bacterium]
MFSVTTRRSTSSVSNNLSRAALLALVVACGESKEERTQTAIKAVSAESALAVAVDARPLSPLWDVDRASERLVRAGIAPRRITPTPDVPPFFSAATSSAAFHVGRDGEVRVFIFADSAARRRATGALDERTVAPAGAGSPWAERPMLIVGQNLAAVMLGGRDQLRERVQLALEAGLPMPAKE